MKKKKKLGPGRYLPVRICGEDVIIDYESRELVFPNREQEDKIDLSHTTGICCYLKEEGFLDDMGTVTDAESRNLAECTQGIYPAGMDSESPETAEVTYAKPVGNARTLVGLYWGTTSRLGRRVEDFALERLGKVEACGVDKEYGRSGWAIVARFRSCTGDTIALRFDTPPRFSNKAAKERKN